MTARDPHPGVRSDANLSPALLLAALARAACHRADPSAPVPFSALLAHLDIPMRSAGAREARQLLTELEARGAVSRSRRHSVPLWALTSAGRRRLARTPRAAAALPDSPQHRAWRQARTTAALEIDRFRRRLRTSLADAAELLRTRPPAFSDQWFELAERLRSDCWMLGSASHCLHEWAEPDDRYADIDEGVPGRRNLRLWRDRPR